MIVNHISSETRGISIGCRSNPSSASWNMKTLCPDPSFLQKHLAQRRPVEIDQAKLLICPTWFGLTRGEAAKISPGLLFLCLDGYHFGGKASLSRVNPWTWPGLLFVLGWRYCEPEWFPVLWIWMISRWNMVKFQPREMTWLISGSFRSTKHPSGYADRTRGTSLDPHKASHRWHTSVGLTDDGSPCALSGPHWLRGFHPPKCSRADIGLWSCHRHGLACPMSPRFHLPKSQQKHPLHHRSARHSYWADVGLWSCHHHMGDCRRWQPCQLQHTTKQTQTMSQLLLAAGRQL